MRQPLAFATGLSAGAALISAGRGAEFWTRILVALTILGALGWLLDPWAEGPDDDEFV